MQHQHIMKAVDCTFRDMRDTDRPFGGLTCVFDEDFQQILPVVVRGSRGQTVGACIQWSALWRSIIILHLWQNMRLNTNIEAEQNFAQWRLSVGQGLHTDVRGNILLPDHFWCRENSVWS